MTRQRFLDAAACMHERVVFTGRLVHEELADLLPACEALVVPSTFPEAYGMVAAEAACCGTLPISADHSGLAEVSRVLEAAVPREVAPWLRFRLDDDAVPAPRDVPDPLARGPRPAARTHPARARPVRPRTLLVGRRRPSRCSRPPKAGSTTSLGSTVAPARNEATWRGAGVATRRPPVGG